MEEIGLQAFIWVLFLLKLSLEMFVISLLRVAHALAKVLSTALLKSLFQFDLMLLQ